MARIPKTILHVEVTDTNFCVQYNGEIAELPLDKKLRKHDERLMNMLIASDELLSFFYRIVTPVVRFKRRQASKAAKAAKASGNAQQGVK